MTDIPIELFAIFVAIPIAIIGIGLFIRLGALVAVGGMLLIVVGLLTDVLIMGKIPESSTSSGSTTTYVMVDNLFIFTEWHKIVMLLMGVFIMLISPAVRRD